MEIRHNEFNRHVKNLSHILAEVCALREGEPLLSVSDEAGTRAIGVYVSRAVPHQRYREVTSDLGRREKVLGFPVPNALRPRYWIGVHEAWRASKKRVTFVSCGFRLYMGFADEQIVQILRLEWVAPGKDREGMVRYDGGHAGHPHWHIDRSALLGHEDYWRSLAILTAPASEAPLETFEPERNIAERFPVRQAQDCSWLQGVHFPAHASWMHRTWDGTELPAPHQSEPNNLASLSRWWNGAIRYLAAELYTHAV
jgi:hypothetical protein